MNRKILTDANTASTMSHFGLNMSTFECFSLKTVFTCFISFSLIYLLVMPIVILVYSTPFKNVLWCRFCQVLSVAVNDVLSSHEWTPAAYLHQTLAPRCPPHLPQCCAVTSNPAFQSKHKTTASCLCACFCSGKKKR